MTVPRRSDIVARTGDGAIRLDGVNGRLELRTGDGAIRVAGANGELLLNTGDGAITVDGAEGKLSLETGDGGVNVEGKLSSVKMHTGDGSIVYRVEPGARDGRRLGHLHGRRLGLAVSAHDLQRRARCPHR